MSVHQFTGALLSANVYWCCESLSGYYDDSTGLSVSLQSDLMRRIDLFSVPWRGTGEGRGGAGRESLQYLHHMIRTHCIL